MSEENVVSVCNGILLSQGKAGGHEWGHFFNIDENQFKQVSKLIEGGKRDCSKERLRAV